MQDLHLSKPNSPSCRAVPQNLVIAVINKTVSCETKLFKALCILALWKWTSPLFTSLWHPLGCPSTPGFPLLPKWEHTEKTGNPYPGFRHTILILFERQPLKSPLLPPPPPPPPFWYTNTHTHTHKQTVINCIVFLSIIYSVQLQWPHCPTGII